MKVLIRPEADADLEGIFEWIANDNPRAAADMIQRIRAKLGLLATTGFAEIGRRGRERGTRELIAAPSSSSTRSTKSVMNSSFSVFSTEL
jgi:plasmid stabilization system protein ParE